MCKYENLHLIIKVLKQVGSVHLYSFSHLHILKFKIFLSWHTQKKFSIIIPTR